jgi:hypothetical protein
VRAGASRPGRSRGWATGRIAVTSGTQPGPSSHQASAPLSAAAASGTAWSGQDMKRLAATASVDRHESHRPSRTRWRRPAVPVSPVEPGRSLGEDEGATGSELATRATGDMLRRQVAEGALPRRPRRHRLMRGRYVGSETAMMARNAWCARCGASVRRRAGRAGGSPTPKMPGARLGRGAPRR